MMVPVGLTPRLQLQTLMTRVATKVVSPAGHHWCHYNLHGIMSLPTAIEFGQPLLDVIDVESLIIIRCWSQEWHYNRMVANELCHVSYCSYH